MPRVTLRCSLLFLGRFVACTLSVATLGAASLAQPATVAPWRVECSGNGKTLTCNAIEQVVQRNDKQQMVPLTTILVRYSPETKTSVMQILLPLGVSLSEPLLVRVDDGEIEKQQIQTCGSGGCVATMTLSDKMRAAMRTGTTLKVTVQDANRKPIELPMPLLGFAAAYDKAK